MFVISNEHSILQLFERFVYICMKFYLFSKKVMHIVTQKFEDTKDGQSKDRQYHGNHKKDKR